MKRRDFMLAGWSIGLLTTKLEVDLDPHFGWLGAYQENLRLWNSSGGSDRSPSYFEARDEEVQRLLLTTQPKTLGGAGAQLEFALQAGLVGDTYKGSLEGLDTQMFQQLATTLKGGFL